MLQFASEALRADRDLVLLALQDSGASLRFASEDLRSDPAIVEAAIRKWPESVKYALGEAASSTGVAIAAVRGKSEIFPTLPESLRMEREVFLALPPVARGAFLSYASTEVRADREVVLDSVSRHGSAIQYASFRLKGDAEVVLAAV